ncbi:MAG: AtpZ/AtpI family protein [Saprospiraceae bacterium]|nr:AtpZ/AtpI family protein [Saprospiraceae bacterium]
MLKKPSDYNAYFKYAGLAFQIFGILAVGAFAGQYLDRKLGLSQPWMTILIVLFFFIGIIYKIVLDTRNKP